jgi:hypothetical protein
MGTFAVFPPLPFSLGPPRKYRFLKADNLTEIYYEHIKGAWSRKAVRFAEI